MSLAMPVVFVCVLIICKLSLFIGRTKVSIVIVGAMRCKMGSMPYSIAGIRLFAV